jgi:hypothetical protein
VNGRVDGLVESMNDRFVELDEHVSERIVELFEGMNERLAKVTESVYSRFRSVASEIKQSRQELSKNIEVNAKEIVNRELASFKEAIAANDQRNLSKFNELSSRVINLQDKVNTISCFRSSKSTADSQVTGHINIVRSTTAEARMPTCVNECIEFTGTDDVGISACLSEGSGAMPVCTNRNMQCSNNGADNQTELSNESSVQWNSNLISDLTLTKFTDAAKQNAVQFLTELDSYFALRRVPETLKLQIVNRAISDKYVIQWLVSQKRSEDI